MKKNEIKLIIFFNVILIIIMIVIAEFYLYKEEEKKTSLKYNLFTSDFDINFLLHREPCGLEYKKPPVIIYGCSFAYGDNIGENEHLGYILSELTKRPVYNFGICGMGLQQALYLLQTRNKIEPAPEFLIYVFMDDQTRRLYMKSNFLYPVTHMKFEEKNGKFLPKKDYFYFLKNIIFFQRLYYKMVYAKIPEAEKFRLIKKYLYYIKKEADEKYPGIKLIFLYYLNSNSYEHLTKENLNEIRALGYDVINSDDIIDTHKSEYHISEFNGHPSAKAWKELVSYIVGIEKM